MSALRSDLRPDVVAAYLAVFRKAGRDDHMVDGVELEAARAGLPTPSADEVREAIVRVFVEDGIELSGRALTMALGHAGEDVGWAFGERENNFHNGNQALRDLDKLLHDHFLDAKGPLGPMSSSEVELSRLVRDALVMAKQPKAVKAYLDDLFRRVDQSLQARSGRVPESKRALDGVRARFKLDGSSRTPVPIHPSELEAMRTAPKSTLAWYNSVHDDFAPGEAGYARSGEPRKDMVGLLNDLIADGALSADDVETIQTHFDRYAAKPAEAWSWFNRNAPLPPRASYAAVDLANFKEAVQALPPHIVSAAHKDQLLSWVVQLERDGRVYDDPRGRDAKLSCLALPAPAATEPRAPVLEHEFDYAATLAADVKQQIWKTTALTRPQDRVRALSKIALAAMRELQTRGKQVTVDGKTYLASEGAETRRVGCARVHAESKSSAEAERQVSKKVLWGLLGSVKERQHGSEASRVIVDGNAETHQIVGRCYDLSPAIADASAFEQQQVAQAYRARLAPCLAAIDASLSRIIDNLVELELTGQTPPIPELIGEMIAWAHSTSFRASCAGTEYLGPTRGERSVNVDVMHHWVLDRLLGTNS